MTKDTAKDYLPLVQALADGKTIQNRNRNSLVGWSDMPDPVFSDPPDWYRIKPEPRELWVKERPAQSPDCWDYDPSIVGVEGAIHFRQVL